MTSSSPPTRADIEALVTMLMAACDDAGMNDTLDRLLSEPDERRKRVVLDLLRRFREAGAPQVLSDAFTPLLDDAIAEKAYVAIYECRR